MISTVKNTHWLYATAAVAATATAGAAYYYVHAKRQRAKQDAKAAAALPPTRGGHVRADGETLASKCFPNDLRDWDAASAAAGDWAAASAYLRLKERADDNQVVVCFDPVFLERHRQRLKKIVQEDLLSDTSEPSPMAADSVYLGNPGIAYALLRLASFFPENEPERQACLNKADEVLARPLTIPMQMMWDRTRISLQSGEAGVCVARALHAHARGDHENAAKVVKNMLTLPTADVNWGLWNRFTWWFMDTIYTLLLGITLQDITDSNEWLYGRAGYIHACELLRRTFHDGTSASKYDSALLQEIRAVRDDVVRATVLRGRAYAQSQGKASPLMYTWAGSEYLGAAHGIMGILHTFLDVLSTYDDDDDERLRQDVSDSVDYVASKEQFLDHEETMGGHYGHYDDGQPASSVQMCHGATGAVWLFSKAFDVLGNDKYKALALRSGDAIWRHGLLQKGPGVCHGMSGSGYAMLRLFRLTRDAKWLHRACAIGDYMLSDDVVARSRTPDNPVSLFEGSAGAALFLADVLRPNVATLPLFELPEVDAGPPGGEGEEGTVVLLTA